MPFLLAVVPYLIIEALAFWAVASWLGVGPAILVVFALMAIGLTTAGVEMRRVSRAASARRIGAGRLAADYGLLTTGAILAGVPGIVSSVVGLLLIFPPTRALARRTLAVKLVKTVEDFGVRSFEATTAHRDQASYGSFRGGPSAQDPRDNQDNQDPMVIDEEELEEWTRSIRPEDFGDDDQPGDKR